ncbi:MAG: hypothetical protein AAGI25_19655, partial [Bacteroidota bacterium]
YVDPDGQELTVFAAIAIGAAIGAGTYTASVGFSDGGFSNWNWGQFALGIGGLSGAAGFGVGEAFKGAATGLGTSVMKAGVHGITQGTISAGAATIQGGDATQAFLMGAASGAAGSAFGSAFGEVSGKAGIQLGINAAGGALIGGGASAWAGGDFWEGAATGATVSVANHWLHRVFDSQKHPTESDGFTGQTKKDANGVTVYQIKGSGVSYRWVYSDWSVYSSESMLAALPGGNKFRGTEMGQDLNEFSKTKIFRAMRGISEAVLEKVIRWPFPLPVFNPEFILPQDQVPGPPQKH